MAEDVDAVMATIPEAWRNRWCGSENGPCACMGCVQIGNRLIMAKAMIGHAYGGDPEYIDETKIPEDIYKRFKVSRDEWEAWKTRQPTG